MGTHSHNASDPLEYGFMLFNSPCASTLQLNAGRGLLCLARLVTMLYIRGYRPSSIVDEQFKRMTMTKQVGRHTRLEKR